MSVPDITNLGLRTRYGHMTIPSLLLMDDITLMADSPIELHSMPPPGN